MNTDGPHADTSKYFPFFSAPLFTQPSIGPVNKESRAPQLGVSPRIQPLEGQGATHTFDVCPHPGSYSLNAYLILSIPKVQIHLISQQLYEVGANYYPHFANMETKATKRLVDLFIITQSVAGRTEIQTQMICVQNLYFEPLHCLSPP